MAKSIMAVRLFGVFAKRVELSVAFVLEYSPLIVAHVHIRLQKLLLFRLSTRPWCISNVSVLLKLMNV